MTQILLLFHVLGVALFFGGIMTEVIWMKQAAGAKDPAVAQFTLASLRRLKMWTLHLGGALILISGFWMALAEPVPLTLSGNPWLLISVILFFGVLGLAMGAQAPLQKRMMALAKANAPDFGAAFSKLAARWNALSIVNIIFLIVVLGLMIFHPGRS